MAARTPLVLIGGEKQQLDSTSDYIATGALPTLTLADTNASHTLNLTAGSNLTANRTFTITTGDANRTLTLTGDASISGTHTGTSSNTNTGDQTITLTGDVTGSGTGSFAATIANDAVTNAKLANVATATIKGRNTASTGDPEDLSLSTVRTMLAVDYLAIRILSEVSITGAVSLSAGTHCEHLLAATGASDYTITVMSASGLAGRAIGFSFRQNAGVLIRLTGATMGGFSDLYYITGETLILRSNGTTWDIESEYLRKPWFKAERTSNASVTTATWTTAPYNIETDLYSIYDNSTYIFTANRPGRWNYMHFLLGGPDSVGLTFVGCGFRVNTTSGVPILVQTMATSSSRRVLCHGDIFLSKGDTFQPAGYVAHSGSPVIDYTESNAQLTWLGHE